MLNRNAVLKILNKMTKKDKNLKVKLTFFSENKIQILILMKFLKDGEDLLLHSKKLQF